MSEAPVVFKSGYVALVGRPNVGKSTLLNAFMHQKIAAVSPRPQTTRQRQFGILTSENAQVIFVDTPGIHKPQHKLGEYMNDVALEALVDADVILWIVDGSILPTEEDLIIANKLAELKDSPPQVLALNKVDLLERQEIASIAKAYKDLAPQAEAISFSATQGMGRERLMESILTYLPEGPLYFDQEQVTDKYEREIAGDLIREAALLLLREEVPHSIAIRVDEYTERGEEGAYIAATLFVERESHKGIVIGKGAVMLKKIGSLARQQIEAMSGRKVFLDLRVKVNKNWRSDANALRTLGYSIEKK